MNSKSKKLDKDKTIIFSNKILALLNEELMKAIGHSATAELNYEQGKTVGASLVGNNKCSSMKEIENYIKKLIIIGHLSGVNSEDSVVEIKNNKIIIRGKNELNIKIEGKTNPTCNYIIGEVIGFLEKLTGEKWKGKETKCISLGHKYDEVIIEKDD